MRGHLHIKELGGNDWELTRLTPAHRSFLPYERSLFNALFITSNPIPVKTALAFMGRIGEEFRLPLCPMGEGNKEKLKKALKDYGLI